MSPRSRNTQMFALPAPPPAEVVLAGATYRLVSVFKHDFFAATSLYRSDRPAEVPLVVVKIYRTQPFAGLPLGWLGRFSRDHERGIYAALAGVEGVPRWVGQVGQAGLAIEYIDAAPLDHGPAPAGWFDRMRSVLDHLHARGLAYGDANKRSNMLVTPDGRAFIIDFQIALRRRDDWPWPLRNILASAVRYLQRQDFYHLYKHKRRMAPAELTEEEDRLSRERSGLVRAHRKLTKTYRALRRRFLRAQHRAGRLQSPSADLEHHHQPEKETWRND